MTNAGAITCGTTCATSCDTTVHVTSCGWWKSDDGFMCGHPFTNHNSPHGRVVTLALLMVDKATYNLKSYDMSMTANY